jgi:hypothetical protein
MVGFMRKETMDGTYEMEMVEIPIEQVMLLEKTLPETYINERGNDVTEEFVKWCRPLIGPKLPEFVDFK